MMLVSASSVLLSKLVSGVSESTSERNSRLVPGSTAGSAVIEKVTTMEAPAARSVVV